MMNLNTIFLPWVGKSNKHAIAKNVHGFFPLEKLMKMGFFYFFIFYFLNFFKLPLNLNWAKGKQGEKHVLVLVHVLGSNINFLVYL